MEKRDKKARLQSLTELRRLRIEGGSRIEALKKVSLLAVVGDGDLTLMTGNGPRHGILQRCSGTRDA